MQLRALLNPGTIAIAAGVVGSVLKNIANTRKTNSEITEEYIKSIIINAREDGNDTVAKASDVEVAKSDAEDVNDEISIINEDGEVTLVDNSDVEVLDPLDKVKKTKFTKVKDEEVKIPFTVIDK
jgi:ArsR family metal-binding transcriptional regulator